METILIDIPAPVRWSERLEALEVGGPCLQTSKDNYGTVTRIVTQLNNRWKGERRWRSSGREGVTRAWRIR